MSLLISTSNTAWLLDTNIFMYAVGGEHPLRAPCVRIVHLTAEHPDRFLTDAEVFQEILHRYRAVNRWETNGQDAFNAFIDLMHRRIEPVYAEDVARAAAFSNDHPSLSARDLLHAAVAERLGLSHIISADADFDRMPSISRLAPERVAEWAAALL